jgi:hypothetical protein
MNRRDTVVALLVLGAMGRSNVQSLLLRADKVLD